VHAGDTQASEKWLFYAKIGTAIASVVLLDGAVYMRVCSVCVIIIVCESADSYLALCFAN
jgi:hypothetical protein